MSEEQESTEKPEETTPEVKEEPKPKEEKKISTPLLDAVDEKYAKLKELDEQVGAKLDRMEAVYTRMMFSGKADASISEPPKKEQTDEEYAKDFMDGKIGFSKA
jgi:hypothetical protein